MPAGKPEAVQWQVATDLKEEQKPTSLVGAALEQAKVERLKKHIKTTSNFFIIY
jgi:hypothetical protein